MKISQICTTALMAALSLTTPVAAENLSHINQLLSTKQCAGCDLSGSGLVLANLTGANLAGANLRQANLSRANLTGADLSNADLSGASLNGANLAGANLIGANLSGADLRDAYLANANLTGVSLDTAYMQGAIGIPLYAGTPEQFHRWAVAEAEKGNYTGAIEHYNRALNLNAEFAPAYLGRALVRYRLGNVSGAVEDGEIAAKLFEDQNNLSGYQASENLLQGIELAQKPQENQGGSKFQQILSGIGSLLLRFLF